MPLDAAPDFFIDIENVNLALKLLIEVFETCFHLRQVKNHLLGVELERQVRCNRVGQPAGIVNAGNGSQDFRRNLFIQFDVMIKLLHHGAAQGFNFAALVASDSGYRLNRRQIGREVQLTIFNFVDPGALLPLNQDLDGAIG